MKRHDYSDEHGRDVKWAARFTKNKRDFQMSRIINTRYDITLLHQLRLVESEKKKSSEHAHWLVMRKTISTLYRQK